MAKSIEALKQTLSMFEQGGLKSDITRFTDQFDQVKRLIESKIRSIPEVDRRGSFMVNSKSFKLQFGSPAMDWFWRRLPPVNPRLSHGVKPGDPGDGVIISQYLVERARTFLRRFCDAWYEVNENTPAAPTDRFRLDAMTKMPKIAMVLWVARKPYLFNLFVENEIDDSQMDREPYIDFDQLLPAYQRYIPEATYIFAQYSRARERPWRDGDNLRLQIDEPLPLEHLGELGRSQAVVDRVRDLWHPEKEYARKIVKPDEDSRQTIATEIQNLKDLCRDEHGHHLVSYVKTYERGDEIGILLIPVARETLDSLLRKYARNQVNRREYRQILLRACGCLAYSLCYLHNVKTLRHRDVKPHNILCYQPGEGPEEFLWSDFGLAFNFGEQGVSMTYDHEFRATPQYEAPEINGEEGSIHGRSADVFSFGCILLEIVSVLAMSQNHTLDKPPVREYWNYKMKLPALGEWIKQTRQDLKKSNDRTLKNILKLSTTMIAEEPRNRKKIGDVTLELSKLKISKGDTSHLFCERCVPKLVRDQSNRPDHPKIFKHVQANWRSRLPRAP